MGPPRGTDEFARLLRALPASCGPVRLVGVDGHAGSGKSTFTARLAAELGGAPVLALDDLASHDAFFDWTARFTAQVAVPLSRGATARYEVYDWERRARSRTAELPPRPVVLVEGVGAGRRALRPWLACLVWMDRPRQESWARGMRRDGPGQAGFWAEWTRSEDRHFSADPSRAHACFLARECGEGYEVRLGPGGTVEAPLEHHRASHFSPVDAPCPDRSYGPA